LGTVLVVSFFFFLNRFSGLGGGGGPPAGGAWGVGATVVDLLLVLVVSVLLFFLNGLIFLNNSEGGGGPPGGGGGGVCEKALLQKMSSPKHTISARDSGLTFFICDNQLVKLNYDLIIEIARAKSLCAMIFKRGIVLNKKLPNRV